MLDLTAAARTMLAAGASPDDVARELLRHTTSPIAVIKALVDTAGMSLGDAKPIVHRNLNPPVREAAERLWQELVAAFDEDREKSSEDETPSGSAVSE